MAPALLAQAKKELTLGWAGSALGDPEVIRYQPRQSLSVPKLQLPPARGQQLPGHPQHRGSWGQMPQWQSQMTGSAIDQSALSASRQSAQHLGQASEQVEKERTLRPGGLCSLPATLTPSSGVLLSPASASAVAENCRTASCTQAEMTEQPLTFRTTHPTRTPAARTLGQCLGPKSGSPHSSGTRVGTCWLIPSQLPRRARLGSPFVLGGGQVRAHLR